MKSNFCRDRLISLLWEKSKSPHPLFLNLRVWCMSIWVFTSSIKHASCEVRPSLAFISDTRPLKNDKSSLGDIHVCGKWYFQLKQQGFEFIYFSHWLIRFSPHLFVFSWTFYILMESLFPSYGGVKFEEEVSFPQKNIFRRWSVVFDGSEPACEVAGSLCLEQRCKQQQCGVLV